MTTCKACNGTKFYIGAGLYPPEPCKSCTKATKHDCAEVYTFEDFLNASGECVYYDAVSDITHLKRDGHAFTIRGETCIKIALATIARTIKC